jgi:cytochrome d ubiquinol oxidase subunit I
MIGFGMAAALGAVVILWGLRRGRTPRSRWWARGALLLPLLPLAANSFGWIFTEMGRQPWVVFGQMFTDQAVSPSVSPGEALTSLIVLTALYGVLAVVEVRLLLKYAKILPPADPPGRPIEDEDAERPLAFAY